MSAAHKVEPCPCPICVIGRSMQTISDAHDAWIEREADLESNHYYFVDEVQAVLRSPRWRRLSRKRLKAALRTIGRADDSH